MNYHTLYAAELNLRRYMRWLWNGIRDCRGTTYGGPYAKADYDFSTKPIKEKLNLPVSGLPGYQLEGKIKIKMNVKELGIKNYLPHGGIDEISKECAVVPLSVSKVLDGAWKNDKVVAAALKAIFAQQMRLTEFVLRPEVREFLEKNDLAAGEKYRLLSAAFKNIRNE